MAHIVFQSKIKKVLRWFESLLLAPATILGIPLKAGLKLD